MEEIYSILKDLICLSRYVRSTAGDEKEVASAHTPPSMNDRCVEVIIIYHPAWSHTGYCQRQDVKGEFTSLGHDLMAYSLGEAEKTV